MFEVIRLLKKTTMGKGPRMSGMVQSDSYDVGGGCVESDKCNRVTGVAGSGRQW